MKVVYRIYCDGGHLLYVGVSKNLVARLYLHRRISPWFSEQSRIEVEGPLQDHIADVREGLIIQVEKPKHNINGRAKAFPSLDLRCQSPQAPKPTVNRKKDPKKMTKCNASRYADAMVRTKQVAQMHAIGYSYTSIGSALGISRQRAQQIASRAGK